MKINYKVKDKKYTDIKVVLKEEFCFSSSYISKLKKISAIIVNEKPIKNYVPIKLGDSIEIELDNNTDESENIVATKMNLDILYEDDILIIVNKPADMPVHPSILHYDNTLSNGIKYYYKQKRLSTKIRPINRLDKDTSGIVIFAKYPFIQNCFVKQMNNNQYSKKYIGIVEGAFEHREGTIKAPIVRKEDSIIERKVDMNCSIESAKAITHYKTIKEYENYSVVKYIIETGRTHQIRVHSAYCKHPILGDSLYGNSSDLIDRQALHCNTVTFIHPISKKQITVIAPIPDDMKKLINEKVKS